MVCNHHLWATPLFSMRTELLVSLQSCRSADADVPCKQILREGQLTKVRYIWFFLTSLVRMHGKPHLNITPVLFVRLVIPAVADLEGGWGMQVPLQSNFVLFGCQIIVWRPPTVVSSTHGKSWIRHCPVCQRQSASPCLGALSPMCDGFHRFISFSRFRELLQSEFVFYHSVVVVSCLSRCVACCTLL